MKHPVRALHADDVAVVAVWKLARILTAVHRDHSAILAGPKPIWATEIDWNSNPPARGPPSLQTQAQLLARAMYELWLPDVDHVLWYLIRDPGAQSWNPGAGLYFQDGAPKPSA